MTVFWTLMGVTVFAMSYVCIARRTGCYPWGIKAPKEPPAEKYGHPWAPVPELRKVLPKAPSNHAWEISVDVDTKGDYILTLGLLSLIDGRKLGTKTANLTWDRLSGMSWDECYRRWSSIKSNSFNGDLIAPLKEWAEQQARLNATGEPRNVEYHLETGA